MPTTRVEPYYCGTDWSGWLDGVHPTVEDGEVRRKVCFSNRPSGCKYVTEMSVKNCVYPTSFTNFIANLLVIHVTVLQTEYEAKILKLNFL